MRAPGGKIPHLPPGPSPGRLPAGHGEGNTGTDLREENSTLANSPQARKRARQAEKRRKHNAAMRSMVRTYLKKVNAAIASGDQQAAQERYREAVSVLDKATRKGKFHANKAARHKSRLNAKIRAMGS